MDSIQVNAGVHVAAEVVLLPRQRGGEAHRRLAVAGALAFLCVLAGSALLSQHTRELERAWAVSRSGEWDASGTR